MSLARLPLPVTMAAATSLGRSAPRRVLLLLLLLLVCLSHCGHVVSALQPIDVAGAKSHWLTANANAMNGSCFNSSSRVYTYPNPLYPQSVTLESADWASHYLHTWIAKLLLEELIGYKVLINDDYSDPSSYTLSRLAAGTVGANVEWWNTNDDAYSEYVVVNRSVRDDGDLGINGQYGIYISKYTLTYNPTMILDYYRYYKSSSDGLLAMPVFQNSTWANLINPHNGFDMLFNDSGSLICSGDNATYAANGQSLDFAGCTDGLFYPSTCVANPMQSCLVLYHPNPLNDNGAVPLIVNNRLNFTVAFINNFTSYISYLAQVQRTPLMFWWKSPDPLLSLQCTDPKTLKTANCFQRLLFQAPQDGCSTCDWPQLNLQKVTSTAVRSLSRPNSLFAAMSLMPADDTSMFNLLAANGNNYKAAACSWLQNNTAIWSSWIAPPAACAATDMQYTLEECAASGGTYKTAISWSFTQPKSCAAGLALPVNDAVDCQAQPVTASSVGGLAALCTVVLLFPVLLGAFQLYELRSTGKPRLMILSMSSYSQLALSLGLSLLAVEPLTALFPLSEAVCSARLFLCLLGFSSSLVTLTATSKRLVQLTSGLLSANSPKKEAMQFVAFLGANLLTALLGTQVLSSENMLSSVTVVSPAGAKVAQQYCASPPYATLAVLLCLNGVALVLTSKRLTSAALHLRRNLRLYRDRPHTKEAHASQFYSLAGTLLLLLIGGIVLLAKTVGAGQSPNLPAVQALLVTLVLLVPLSTLMFVCPSILLYRSVRARKAAKAKSKAAEAENSKSRNSTSSSEAGLELATLAGTLSDPLALVLFQNYAESSLESENIGFLLAVQTFVSALKRDGMTVAQVMDGAKDLYVRFIGDNAENQINISAKQKGELEHDLRTLSQRVETIRKANGSSQPLHSAQQLFGQSGEDKAEDGADVGKHQPTIVSVPATGLGGRHGRRQSSDEMTYVSHYDFGFLPNPGTPIRRSMLDSNNSSTISMNGVSMLTPSANTMPAHKAKEAFAAPSLGLTIASRELKNAAKSVFDPAVKEVFALMTVNAWPRFLHSKQASRANELLSWTGFFHSMNDREQRGTINKLRKMHFISSIKRGSKTDGGLGEATYISQTGMSSYARDREDPWQEHFDGHGRGDSLIGGTASSLGGAMMNTLMSPASNISRMSPVTERASPLSAATSNSRKSSLTLQSALTVGGSKRGSYVPIGLAAADDVEELHPVNSPSSNTTSDSGDNSSAQCAHSPGQPASRVTIGRGTKGSEVIAAAQRATANGGSTPSSSRSRVRDEARNSLIQVMQVEGSARGIAITALLNEQAAAALVDDGDNSAEQPTEGADKKKRSIQLTPTSPANAVSTLPQDGKHSDDE